jgi:O-antigen/teichoic acid export membrane protein
MAKAAVAVSGLFSDSLIVLVWQAVRLISSYALIFALTRMLGPEGLARYANFIGLTSIAVPIFLLKPEAIVARARFHNDEQGYVAYAGSIVGYCAIGSLACFVAVILFRGPAEKMTGIEGWWLLLLAPYLLAYGVLYVASTILQLDGYMNRSAMTRGIEGLFRLLLGLGFVGAVGLGWGGSLLAVVGAVAGAAILSWYRLYQSGRLLPKLQFGRSLEYFHEGFPTVPLTLAMAGMQTIDRFSITSKIGLAEAGVYAFAAMLASAIWLLAFAFQQAWTPWIYKILTEPSPERMGQARTVFLVFLGGVALLGLGLVAVAIVGAPLFLSGEYQGLAAIIVPLTFASVFSSWRLPFESVFYYFKKTWWLSAFGFAGLAAAAAGIWMVIGPLGVVGVAWIMAGGQAAVFIATATFAVREVAAHARRSYGAQA